jgi:hypothetical protein
VSYPIIHVPTYSSSNENKGPVVIFIPLQLTLGRVAECIGDHVRLLDYLQNGATLTEEIVASSVLPIIEILVIEDHKLGSIFLHVIFGSQSLLKPTSDQTGSDNN